MSVGIDRGQYSRFETGKAEPSLPTLRKIAKALDIKIADIFSDDESYDINSYNSSLVDKVKIIDKLEDEQKKIIFGVIDSFITSYKLKNALSNALNITL